MSKQYNISYYQEGAAYYWRAAIAATAPAEKAQHFCDSGKHFLKFGDKHGATEAFIKELKYRQPEERKAIGKAINRIAHAYIDLENWPDALEYFYKSLAHGGTKVNSMIAHIHMGICFAEMKQEDFAFKHFDMAFKIAGPNPEYKEMVIDAVMEHCTPVRPGKRRRKGIAPKAAQNDGLFPRIPEWPFQL